MRNFNSNQELNLRDLELHGYVLKDPDPKNQGRYKVHIPDLHPLIDQKSGIWCKNHIHSWRMTPSDDFMSGQYFPVQPGTKVTVKFRNNDFQSGYIDGVVSDQVKQTTPKIGSGSLPNAMTDRDDMYVMFKTPKCHNLFAILEKTSDGGNGLTKQLIPNSIHLYYNYRRSTLIMNEDGIHWFTMNNYGETIEGHKNVWVNQNDRTYVQGNRDVYVNGYHKHYTLGQVENLGMVGCNNTFTGPYNIQSSVKIGLDAPAIMINCGISLPAQQANVNKGEDELARQNKLDMKIVSHPQQNDTYYGSPEKSTLGGMPMAPKKVGDKAASNLAQGLSDRGGAVGQSQTSGGLRPFPPYPTRGGQTQMVNLAAISSAISSPISALSGVTVSALSKIPSVPNISSITSAATGAISSATGAVTGAVSGVTGAVSGVVGGVTGAVSGVVGGVTGAVSGAVGGVTGAIGGAVGGVTGAIGGVVGGVTGVVGGAVGAVTGTVSGVVGGVTGAVGGVTSSVQGAVSSIASAPTALASSVTAGLSSSLNIGNGISSIGNKLTSLTSSLNSIPSYNTLNSLPASMMDSANSIKNVVGNANSIMDLNRQIENSLNSAISSSITNPVTNIVSTATYGINDIKNLVETQNVANMIGDATGLTGIGYKVSNEISNLTNGNFITGVIGYIPGATAAASLVDLVGNTMGLGGILSDLACNGSPNLSLSLDNPLSEINKSLENLKQSLQGILDSFDSKQLGEALKQTLGLDALSNILNGLNQIPNCQAITQTVLQKSSILSANATAAGSSATKNPSSWY